MAAFTPILYFHIIVFLILVEIGHASEEDVQVMEITAPGDFIISGLMPIHEDVEKREHSFKPHRRECIRFEERGLAKSLIMINAIEVMNRSPVLTAVNVTLGYKILDSCSDVNTALRATELVIYEDHHNTDNVSSAFIQPVMAVVGATFSEISIAIARLLTLQMIPQISYSSSAVILSDKNRFPAFMRTIPNDFYQTAAMTTLFNINNWNWVGIVITDGDYGRSASEQFLIQALGKGICVAFSLIIPQSVIGEYTHYAIEIAAAMILNNTKVQVIVSFARSTHVKLLFEELKNQVLRRGLNRESMRRVWVASDSWSSSPSVTRNVSLRDIGHIVGFTHKHGDSSSYNQYLSRLEKAGHEYAKNNPFLQKLFMLLSAAGHKDTEVVSEAVKILRKHIGVDTILSIEMAISAIAQAVASICKSKDCKGPGAVQPWELLDALWMEEFQLNGETYHFDDNGDINLGYDLTMWWSDGNKVHEDDIVAEYHPQTDSFTYTSNSMTQQFIDLKHIISKCTNSCVPGEFKKTAEGQHTCCYECINCTENYYSNMTDMDQCLSCDTSKEWSAVGSSNCTPKVLLFFSWDDSFAIALLFFSALGILLVVLVSALFLHQRDTPVVKAAGGPLSQVILFSLVASYVSAILFVGKPNKLQCKARQVVFGISFTLCVSCILVKTLQILLAFQFNPAVQQALRKVFQPYVIVSLCVSMQICLCISWLVLRSPYAHFIMNPTTLLEECHEGSYLAFGVMLGYIALLAFVCFICAYKGRKLPQNYNESKFITFSMLLYLIAWTLFVPVYVTTSGVYLPAVEMGIILMSNYGILCCHFFPKCYVILFKKEQNTRSAFRKNLYEYSSKTSISASESESPVTDKQSTDLSFISVSSLSVYAVSPDKAEDGKKCCDMTSCTSLCRDSMRRRSRRSSI
ncbi:G-protein coupled receptor family C group 6 member A [Solea senegalensis]|uniref:G-protein coupled receptor family C group 6 member A n=1 Tax=Solea senegalensis TaxID=28829 RepID=A0AAV6PGL6_SOLSE|nr:G-protein coupled receptor family C group 6 member A [Solea senegalensis]KAG7463349.1 G-protein coupled receptor family C group 6 member A [Solea senegalensis]